MDAWEKNTTKEAQMNTILLPLDGSERAEQILPYAQRLALILNAKLHLLQVVPEVQVDDELFSTTVVEAYPFSAEPTATQRERVGRFWETQRQRAEAYLESLALKLQSAEVAVDVEVRRGYPADQIVTVAEQQQASLIALATHGYSGLKRWALGSVADKVVHATSTPVFVIRSGEQTQAGEVVFKRILVPLDGSDFAQQALPLAIELARGAHAELTLFEAVSPTVEAFPGFAPLGRPIPQLGEVLAALRAQAAKQLGKHAEELRKQELPVTTVVANGHAAEVIVDEAKERHADLIVMATHGYSGIRRWALGSVADKVLHASTTPLVLVHASE